MGNIMFSWIECGLALSPSIHDSEDIIIHCCYLLSSVLQECIQTLLVYCSVFHMETQSQEELLLKLSCDLYQQRGAIQ